MVRHVDYDDIVDTYLSRYEENEYPGVREALLAFTAPQPVPVARVSEVGCGTGHWLEALSGSQVTVMETDPSEQMWRRARVQVRAALLARGRAEALPWQSSSFDRVFCVNALHHFTVVTAFFTEARRVLRAGWA